MLFPIHTLFGRNWIAGSRDRRVSLIPAFVLFLKLIFRALCSWWGEGPWFSGGAYALLSICLGIHSLTHSKINTLEGLLLTAHEVKSVSKQTSPLPAWSKAKGGRQVILKACQ